MWTERAFNEGCISSLENSVMCFTETQTYKDVELTAGEAHLPQSSL